MGFHSMLESRGLFSNTEPPNVQTRVDNNPTLLMSWWATGFSLAFIVTRVAGRYVRTNRFFPEDKVMMASIVPLLVRMAFVHVILIWGTNNTKTGGLTAEDIRHREIGSRLVLIARIFYAIFIWTAKYTVCEFLKRVSGMIWRRSVVLFLRFIYYFLASTLIAVVIATLAECQPFDHYWQVVPDPGPQCRSGYANLITMGTCDVITDLLLVAFPIPMIMTANMRLKRKIFLIVLFALSLILVAITSFRVPSVIARHGSQQYRSLLASLEILAATAVSNAVVIGSFIRDKGVKKQKYNKDTGSASVSESLDRSTVRRTTVTHHQWGSDSDLAGDLGIRLQPELYSSEQHKVPRPAPIAVPYHPLTARTGTLDPNWSFGAEDDGTSATDSFDVQVSPHEYIETNKSSRKKSGDDIMPSPRRISIFDVGGLLDPVPTANPNSQPPPHSATTSGPSANPESQRYRRGSRALLQDVGGLLLSAPNGRTRPSPPSPSFSRPIPTNAANQGTATHSRSPSDPPVPPYRLQSDVSGPVIEGNVMELQDVGGLLSRRS